MQRERGELVPIGDAQFCLRTIMGFWRRKTAAVKKLLGAIPYGFAVDPYLTLRGKNHFRITRESPSIQVQVLSLDRVWQTTFKAGWSWKDWREPARSKDTVAICWTPTRGLWLQGSQTGRRTRPMPKFIAAMLCGTLIVTFPKMLNLTLSHAKDIEEPFIAYSLLAGAILLFSGLIAWYMWLAHKAAPNAFFEALRSFVKNIGDEKNSATTEIKSEERRVDHAPINHAE